MEWLESAVNFVLHIDQHLNAIASQYGVWIYLVLFTIVFCETGLVVTPILPGDSLLFATGALAATGAFDPVLMSAVLIVAAVTGDAVNYACGAYVGPKVFAGGDTNRFFKRKHLERTRDFYERHGGKTIVLARFVPIVRTFAPFVAGVGRMPYFRFFAYNVVGGIVWVVLFIGAGYAFGNLPIVRDNFALVTLGIVVVSVLPIVVEYIKARRAIAAPAEVVCEIKQ